jgi:hypothetical protein
MEIISLNEALSELATEKPCTITCITLDKQRGTGGDIRTFEHAIQIGTNHKQATRLVRLPNGKTRSLHIRLITHFNSKKVIY